MTWLYLMSEPGLFTVGFHDPDGRWEAESDHASREDAAARVHWLNGGGAPDLLAALQEALEAIELFHGPAEWETYRDHSPEMKRWRAAIAKARGI